MLPVAGPLPGGHLRAQGISAHLVSAAGPVECFCPYHTTASHLTLYCAVLFLLVTLFFVQYTPHGIHTFTLQVVVAREEGHFGHFVLVQFAAHITVHLGAHFGE